jgi:hypothetical protein
LATGIVALRHGSLRRFLVGIGGGILGTFCGLIVWAIRLNHDAALAGAGWGAGIGVVLGPMLFLAVVSVLNSFAKTHVDNFVGHRENVIDARFEPEERDGDVTSLPDVRNSRPGER